MIVVNCTNRNSLPQDLYKMTLILRKTKNTVVNNICGEQHQSAKLHSTFTINLQAQSIFRLRQPWWGSLYTLRITTILEN